MRAMQGPPVSTENVSVWIPGKVVVYRLRQTCKHCKQSRGEVGSLVCSLLKGPNHWRMKLESVESGQISPVLYRIN